MKIRKFGVVAFVFFGGLCALGLWTQKPLPTYLFGFLCVLGMCFIILPSRMKPIHAAWLNVAHFIGRSITVLMLTFTYFIVVTPSALIKRLFGGRPLPVKPDRNVSSYWVVRTEAAQPKERFLKRY